MRAVIILTTLLVLAPRTVCAQNCANGREPTAEGYCCWPGQHWDDGHQRCDGPPSCPEPLRAAGNECVSAGQTAQATPAQPDWVFSEGNVDYGSGAQTRPPATPPAPAATGTQTPPAPAPPPQQQVAGEVGSQWPSAGSTPPAGARNPRIEHRTDETLQILGATLFGAGYAAALVTGPLELAAGSYDTGPTGYMTANSTCPDAVGGSFFAPLIGGFMAWGFQQNCNVPLYANVGGVAFLYGSRASSVRDHNAAAFAGAIESGVQLIGLALFLIGTLRTVEVTVWDDEQSSVSVAPTFGGVQTTIRF